MEMNKHGMNQLFEQLGLPSEPTAIDAFIETHRLRTGITLAQATFWDTAQASFLTKALAEDSDWSAAVDELSVRLSPRAVA